MLILFLLWQKQLDLLLYTAELFFLRIRERCIILQRKLAGIFTLCLSTLWGAYQPFLSAKEALDLVRENQQSSAHNFVKDFSPIFLKSSRRSPLKKGAATENPLEYGKTEVQILFEPLQAAISSMELPKNFENKKLPNPLA